MLIKLEKSEKKMETINRFAYKTNYIWAKKDSKRLKIVSRVCLGYIVSPYAIMSFEFSVMIFIKFLETGEQIKCGRMWCSYKTACILVNDSPREVKLVSKEC